MTAPIEKLLKKDFKFQWSEQCQESLDVLKNKVVTTPILAFPYRKKEFHLHVDASFVTLNVVLVKPCDEYIDHPIAFSIQK